MSHHGVKLSTGYVGSVASGKCKSRSVTAFALPSITQHEIQKYLQMAATYDSLKGAQERPAANSVQPGAI